jgi:hypothetical protein
MDVLSSLLTTDGVSEIRDSNSLDSILHLAKALKCEIIKGYNIKKSEQGITDQIPDGILSRQTSTANVDSEILYRCKVWSAHNSSTLQKTINFAL